MPDKELLHYGITHLPPVPVVYKLCIFPVSPNKPYHKINLTFQSLREWVVLFGLDPNNLLHIGVPTLDEKVLVFYSCCIEFPLPIHETGDGIDAKVLPGGDYAILRVEKKPSKITKAIRQFQGDTIPENGIIVDENRPIYEIYYKDTMEYCVPIL